MKAMRLQGRPLNPGNARGEAVVVEALSFYGEVNPVTGTLADGRRIGNKILVIGRPRGSTVGSYTIYGLRYYNQTPLAIIVEKEADPVLVAGSVLADIPLIDNVKGILMVASDGDIVVVNHNGLITLYKTNKPH